MQEREPRGDFTPKEAESWTGRGALIIGGQGSQFLGMGAEIAADSKAAKSIWGQADRILGFSISDIAFNGPESDLQEPGNTQLALGVTALAAHAAVLEKYPQLEEDLPVVGGGISFGELISLVPAGVIGFETFLHLVRERGRLVKEISEKNPGKMVSVSRLKRDVVLEICESTGVYPGIYYPGIVVISGGNDFMPAAIEECKRIGGRVTDTGISIPYHTPLMEEVAKGVEKWLSPLEFSDARYKFIPSIKGNPTKSGDIIKSNLPRNLTEPVNALEKVIMMEDEGAGYFVEVGAKPVLSILMRKGNPDFKAIGIHNVKSLNALHLSFTA